MEAFNGAGDQQPYPDMMGAITQGAQAGQTLRGISALQGIDINNPDSLNKGISNLVRAGAADQASALMGLQINRSLYGGLGDFLHQAVGGGGQTQGAAMPTQATTPAASAPQGGVIQPAAGGGSPGASQAPDPLGALHGQIAQDARAYAAASPADQATMKPQLEAKYGQMGIPQEAIDSALQAVSTPEGAGQFADMHDAHAQMYSSGQGDPATAQAALPAAAQPPSPGNGVDPYQWAKNYLSHPEWGNYEAMVKSRLGLDLGLTARAQAIMGPEFSQEADVRNAAAKTSETARGGLQYLPQQKAIEAEMTPPVAGAQPTFDSQGHHIGWQMPNGALQAIGGAAGAKAGAEAAATAPYEGINVPTPSGAPSVVSKARFAAPATQGGMGGQATGATPGAVSYQTGDAKNLTDFTGQIPGRDANSNKIIANGQQVAALASQINSGRFTGPASEIARVLPGKNAQAYAANAGLLAQDLSGSFAQTLNGLAMPRLQIEAKSVLGAIPTTSSPQDQIKLYGAMMAATGEYVQAHDRFINAFADNPSNPKSLVAAEQAWNTGPGKASIMASPEFQKITAGGKPAATPFEYKGKSYVAVLPGLLAKPMIMPAQ